MARIPHRLPPRGGGESPPRGQCALLEKTCGKHTRLHARHEITFFLEPNTVPRPLSAEMAKSVGKLGESGMAAKKVLDYSLSFRLRWMRRLPIMRRWNRRLYPCP